MSPSHTSTSTCERIKNQTENRILNLKNVSFLLQIQGLLQKFKEFVLDWGSFAEKVIAFVDSDLVSTTVGICCLFLLVFCAFFSLYIFLIRSALHD